MGRMHVVADLVNKNKWKRGVELGVFKGQTFFYLLSHCPSLEKLVGVDRWERTPGPVQDRITGFAAYETYPMEEYARKVKSQALRMPEAEILHMDTLAASLLFDHGSFDFVFVDASHDTQSVTFDIGYWLPKIRVGGAIFGHDSNWPSVERAVSQLLPGWAQLPEKIWYYDKET